MKKRLLSVLLACALLLTLLPAAVFAAGPEETTAEGSRQGTGSVCASAAASLAFTDVQDVSSWYYTPVLWAVDNGIAYGETNTVFAPEGICTRAQVVSFLYRAAGSPAVSGSSPFADVKSGDYFFSAVLWAVREKITYGTSDNTFSPYEPCTRGQVAAFLYRAAGSPAVSSDSSAFTDVSADDYFAPAVLWAVQNGVTYGISETSFAPYDGCTRAQVVTFLYRMHGTEASVGSYLIFGSYDQDLNLSSKEPIEWRVLKVEGNKALVISKYILDAQCYHEQYESTTWESSSLRSWLNNVFYYTAFTADERTQILTTTVSAEDNPNYGIDAGNSTQDRIFLLSISEAYALFDGSSRTMTTTDGTCYLGYPDLQAAQTDYAYAQSGNWDTSYKTSDGVLFWWWLRSPGETGIDAALVDCDGLVCTDGYPGCSPSGGIRPAMWITLT